MHDVSARPWSVVPNPGHRGWRCLQCDARYERVDLHAGCPACAARGHASSVAGLYDSGREGRVESRAAPGVYRWGSGLPYLCGLTLGEGSTPVEALPRLAGRLGLRSLMLKNEAANPTGSHKDRMSALALTRALEIGAHRVVLASSGNAGVSAACYAAAAGLRCDVAVYRTLDRRLAHMLEAAGARLHRFDTSFERWRFVENLVVEEGAFPLTNYRIPAVGSPPFGAEAYRSLAFEIHAQCIELPDHVLVPTARGDLLWGLASGFLQLQAGGQIARLPRLWAVEPFARLTAVLEGADYRGDFNGTTQQSSIAGSTVTWQAVQAARLTAGGAVTVNDDQAWQAWRELGNEGWVGELCAAAGLAGLRELLNRRAVQPRDSALLVFTARYDRDSAVPPPSTLNPTRSPE